MKMKNLNKIKIASGVTYLSKAKENIVNKKVKF